MKRSRPGSAQPQLLDPKPVFDRRQRQAMSAVYRAGYWSGRREWDVGADLLLVRMGLQLNNQHARWGYQLSNPTHYALLMRHPEIDDAEPSPAWLRLIYTLRDDRMPLTLASARAELERRRAEHQRRHPEAWGLRRAPETPQPAEKPAQQELFA